MYSAGNLVILDIPIQTNLRSIIVKRYLDTLIVEKGYNVPEKWLHLNKLVDLDSVNNKRIYFRRKPEEMYLVSLQGQLVLSDVYNESIVKNDWVSSREKISRVDEARIKNRFNIEVLRVIESLAKGDGVPDSLIYKNLYIDVYIGVYNLQYYWRKRVLVASWQNQSSSELF